MTGVCDKRVPPDGGYGWVVVFSYGLNMMVVLPIFLSFGLVFKETMSDIGLNHSQGTLVIIINGGTGMLTTFLGGPLLKKFGYRKVAVAGAILSSLGLFITALSSSFGVFIISYSIVNSMGIAATLSAFMVAVNSFFKEKRGRAIGVGISMMGLGTILMPLLMSALLTSFGWRYTILTLSAINLHSLVAACLLRPVKWYLRYPPHSEEMMPLNKHRNQELISANVVSTKVCGFQSNNNADPTTKSTSMISLTNITRSDVSKNSPELLPSEIQYKFNTNLGSSINIFLNEQYVTTSEEKDKVLKKKEQQKGFFRNLIDLFDLTLLNDPILLNILFGLALAASAERNFCLLLPIILQDMKKFETEEIARLMSIIGVTDTLFRFVSPFIGEWSKQPPRVIFFSVLLGIIFINNTILLTSSFIGLVFVALAIGVMKGFFGVYVHIIVPSYVPIERLPFAWGIEMFISGSIGIIIGSIMGQLRQTSGAYHIPIVALNFFIVLAIISWCAEFIYFKIKANRI